MKKTYLLLWLAAAGAFGAACEPGSTPTDEETEPAAIDAPDTAPDPTPEHDEPAPGADTPHAHAPHPRVDERPPVCTPPDPATAPERRPPSEPQVWPTSAEDTEERDLEIVEHPAVIDTDLDRPLTPADHERIALQQRYLDAARALEASRHFASDEEREAARASLKLQVLGE